MHAVTAVEAHRRWTILGVAYLCNLTFAITLQSVPPVLGLVMAELGLSHTQGGLLMSLYALPGVIISIPAGMLADRYGQRLIGTIAFLLGIAGAVIFATGDSLTVLALGRIISGAGAIVLMVLSPQLLAHWFSGREMGVAMGIFHTGFPVGTILALNLLAVAGEGLGWRASIWLSAVLPVASLGLFLALLPSSQPGAHQASAPVQIRPDGGLIRTLGMAGLPVWLVAASWMMFNAEAISLSTFTPDFLAASGRSLTLAGFVTSAVMWPALLIGPATGYLIDRVDGKRTVVALAGLAIAVFVLMVPSAAGWTLAVILLVGIAQAAVPAPVFALVPEVTRPEKMGLAFGIISTSLNAGVLIGPAAAGLARDLTGSYQGSYILMAAFALMITLSMALLGLATRRG
ncbi:MAG: MFS transporter [Chloroflexi bacterium]|nr:MFS transporter [Chloroflexota bacterium]